MNPWWWLVARCAVVAVLGLVAVFVGGPFVEAAFRRIDEASHDGQQSALPSLQQAGDVLRGGRWIGRLERLAIYASLVCSWPSGIAVVLAVKGLARYPELRAPSPGGAERFIIGTFISVLTAAAAAGVAWLTWRVVL